MLNVSSETHALHSLLDTSIKVHSVRNALHAWHYRVNHTIPHFTIAKGRNLSWCVLASFRAQRRQRTLGVALFRRRSRHTSEWLAFVRKGAHSRARAETPALRHTLRPSDLACSHYPDAVPGFPYVISQTRRRCVGVVATVKMCVCVWRRTT